MLMRSRKLTVLLAAGYLLAVTASAPFHNHNGRGEEQPPRPGVSASHFAEHGACSVCQFLAQKPAPAAALAPVSASALVQEVAAWAPRCAEVGVFTAWRSRAPPAAA